ncbi:hypothetical protein IEQ34_015694 [Dendrobium chrysotoxum]|uniref:Uncharacterized protein n=1 Tax=Dendrobium chrysotoxum TaxID=161865 RepID=A0AAV7GIB3_DENCH|nr:hypothetical protein IEQ34_015694 [Dendrobium chrysotoxum]
MSNLTLPGQKLGSDLCGQPNRPDRPAGRRLRCRRRSRAQQHAGDPPGPLRGQLRGPPGPLRGHLRVPPGPLRGPPGPLRGPLRGPSGPLRGPFRGPAWPALRAVPPPAWPAPRAVSRAVRPARFRTWNRLRPAPFGRAVWPAAGVAACWRYKYPHEAIEQFAPFSFFQSRHSAVYFLSCFLLLLVGDFPYAKSVVLFGAEVDMGDPTSMKNLSTKGDRFVARSEGIKKTYKATKTDDVVSTVTGDALLAFRKKYYFPNDMVVKVPARSDRACSPPLGFVTVYEFSLRAGLRFPPSPELSDILMICGVSLAQLSYRAMSIIMGLIVLFRDRGAVLSPDCLARMGRLIGDTQGRISFRSKWLDIRTRDPSKSWISDFFYVKNDWNLLEKWGKMRELPIPLHLGAEELLKILKFSDIDTLHYEVRYLSRYIDEEYLFKVGLSTQAGRSHAQMLKKSVKVSEAAVQSSKIPPKRPGSEDNVQTVKKKRVEEKSAAFKIIVEDHIQEARNHIYDVEVKALEADCMEEGFIRGFMKGVRAVQRKTGAEIDGLTPSQASGDPSSDSGGEEIESELQKAFSLEEDEDDIDIL